MSLKKNAVFVAAVALMGISLVSAQSSQTQLDRGPGMVGAGSPAYGLEVAMDNAALGLGLAKPGKVAQERAAEVRQAAEKNKSKAAARAGKELGKVAQKAKEDDSEDIESAMASFQETMNKMEKRIQNAPNENARQGMQTALENMKGAYQNMQEAKQKREEAGQKGNENGRPENKSGERNQQAGNSSNNSGTGQESGNTSSGEEQEPEQETSDNSTGQNPQESQ